MKILLAILLSAMAWAQTPVSTKTAEHYTWGGCCDGWYLVKNDKLNVIQERMPPGTSETLHRHHKAQQFFFVLKGEATVEVNGKAVKLGPGEGLLVPPGAAHRMRNTSGEPLEFTVTSEPPSHDDREEIPQPK